MGRVVVTGGRDLDDYLGVSEVLAAAHAMEPITLLVHGSCWGTQTAPGLDRMAEDWAKDHGIPYIGVPAWPRLRLDKDAKPDRSAGPRRNRTMLKMHPTRMLAFPGGRGTADAVEAAREYNRAHNKSGAHLGRFCWITRFEYKQGRLVPVATEET
jgi:hypothetical protein